MFSGIVEAMGVVTAVRREGEALRLTVGAAGVMEGTKVGDSIAVNGVCLTVREMDRRSFTADVMPETVRVTTLGLLRPGDPVNLERALRLGDRLGGHLVTGHVDGVGEVLARQPLDNAFLLEIAAPPQVARHLVAKGSVAVDGVSLTVAACRGDRFTVSIIPHTAACTTLGTRRPGDRVNLEADIIGKHVAGLLEPYLSAVRGRAGAAAGGLSLEFLASHGFAAPDGKEG